MKKHSVLLALTLSFVAAAAFSLIPSPYERAHAQACGIFVCKAAEDAGDTVFSFSVERLDESFTILLTAGGECLPIGMPLDEPVEITENTLPGWHVEEIVCDPGGVDVLTGGSSVLATCTTPGGFAECTFVNAEGNASAPIPTLSEWSMMAAAAGLGLAGMFFALRRRKSTA